MKKHFFLSTLLISVYTHIDEMGKISISIVQFVMSNIEVRTFEFQCGSMSYRLEISKNT